jgi:hypothetical protein
MSGSGTAYICQTLVEIKKWWNKRWQYSKYLKFIAPKTGGKMKRFYCNGTETCINTCYAEMTLGERPFCCVNGDYISNWEEDNHPSITLSCGCNVSYGKPCNKHGNVL